MNRLAIYVVVLFTYERVTINRKVFELVYTCE